LEGFVIERPVNLVRGGMVTAPGSRKKCCNPWTKRTKKDTDRGRRRKHSPRNGLEKGFTNNGSKERKGKRTSKNPSKLLAKLELRLGIQETIGIKRKKKLAEIREELKTNRKKRGMWARNKNCPGTGGVSGEGKETTAREPGRGSEEVIERPQACNLECNGGSPFWGEK